MLIVALFTTAKIWKQRKCPWTDEWTRKWHMYVWKWNWKWLSRVRLFVTAWTTQSMEFSRPEYWSGILDIPFSWGSCHSRDWTRVFCIAGGFFTSWATREAIYIYIEREREREREQQTGNEILVSHKKEENFAVYNTMDGPGGYYA